MKKENLPKNLSEKALQVNLDTSIYGTFAEIGAGQEVARHFFQAGRASQTIAKSMSAYDMTFSDEIYGKEKSGRYVCESRLMKMLDKEYQLLIRRLADKRGKETRFFAYANTVATGSHETPKAHGWMGIRFQSQPQEEMSDIILHVRMQDRHRLQQQEALGILGVNLVTTAFFHSDDPKTFISYLVDGIKAGQVVIDCIKVAGPQFKKMSNIELNLELVQKDLAEAILFSPDLEVETVGDALYQKAPLIQRGRFLPMTLTHMDVMEKGASQLKKEYDGTQLPIMEIVFDRTGKKQNLEEIQFSMKLIGKMGYHVLVSNFSLHYQLKQFLRRYTKAPMVIIMDASRLASLFELKAYEHLDGKILEGLGKLFDPETKVYIYPHKTDKSCTTAKTFKPGGKLNELYKYFSDCNQILDIFECDEAANYAHSDDVRKLIAKKDTSWKKLVPSQIHELVQKWSNS